VVLEIRPLKWYSAILRLETRIDARYRIVSMSACDNFDLAIYEPPP